MLPSLLELTPYIAAACAAIAWTSQAMRHRSHMSQCVQDLQRHLRLDNRLAGCVTVIERHLDAAPATAGLEIPEAIVGEVRFLHALRIEAEDNAHELGRHAARLRWSDGYLQRLPLTSRRCEMAHGALITAFGALADAIRAYERGIAQALSASGDGPKARALAAPVRLLSEDAAVEVARLRSLNDTALANTADACRLPYRSRAAFEARWPVRRSELIPPNEDPYRGETRPLSWSGFGTQPLLHVDAR